MIDHRSEGCFNLSGWKEETWKNSGLNGNRTHDLCDTGAALLTNWASWHSQLVRALHQYRESWVRFPFKPEFFQVSSFQPLRLKQSSLRWSTYNSIFIRSSNIWISLGSIPIQAWIFFQVSSFQPLRLEHLHCDDLHIILTYNMLAASLWHECCVWKMINIRPICLKMHRGQLIPQKIST